MTSILLTICARGGSKGVKNKNIEPLAGKPLIYYSIKQALDWKKAKRIVVSTDSEEIAEIAKKYGADVPFFRPKNLATDSAPKLPVVRHALVKTEEIYKEKYDVVVDLDPTSPVRNTNDLDNALKLFLKYKPKTLFSVVGAKKNPYFNMIEKDGKGRVHLSKRINRPVNRRQDAPPVYEMNASIYIFRPDYLRDINNQSVISDDSVAYEMGELSTIDIDREIDFRFIDFLIKNSFVKI